MDVPLIREATSGDAAGIAEVHADGWRWGYRGLLPEALLKSLSTDAGEARWQDTLSREGGDHRAFVADLAGRIVGFASWGPAHDEHPSGAGELYALYVREEVAGRGVGRALMTTAIEDLTARGFDRAILWVLGTNDRAHRFYEIGGWRPDGANKTEPHPYEGVPLHEVRYAFDLRASRYSSSRS